MPLVELVRLAASDVSYGAGTVADALDTLNYPLVRASDFNVKADGVTDDSDALFNLGQHLSSITHPVRVVFPTGVSIVGSQEFAGAAGKGFSYRPTYFAREWGGDLSAAGWFSVYNTDQSIILDMAGWTIKMAAGMKLGSYSPTTGLPFSPSSLPFYSYDYQASQGYLIKIWKAPNVIAFRGTTDGNLVNSAWGGLFGDDGYQVPAYNWWINQSSGFTCVDHIAKNSPLDAFYIGENGAAFAPLVSTQIKGSYFKRVLAMDCGRNITSYTGGANALFEDCEMWRAGNNATGINLHGSAPASCLDVESEGGAVLNVRFRRCGFMHGGMVGVVGGFAAPNDVTGVTFEDCTFHCETGAQSFVNYARNCVLNNCNFYGGVSFDTGTKQDPTVVTNSRFYNRVGGTYIPNFSISGICDKFDNNYVDYQIPSAGTAAIVFNLSGFNPLPGGYGNKQTVRGLRVNLSGNSNNITHTDLGGLTYYSDMSVHITAVGVTGSKNLALYCLDSRPSAEGLSVSGSALINFGGAMLNQPGTGIYWDAANRITLPGGVTSRVDGLSNLGTRDLQWAQVYSKNGLFTRSPNGTLYQITVADNGSVIVNNAT